MTPNEITQVPDYVGDFGLDFSYAAWTPGTEVLLSSVAWNADYRDVVAFKTRADFDKYLSRSNAISHVVKGMTYAKAGQPIRLDLPFNASYFFNYMRVTNPAIPDTRDVPRTFYYFIMDVRYIAPNTTEFIIQLDVFQTFREYVNFGRCYVERGHIGIANTNQFAGYGRDYLTVPEGIDVGGEYQINDIFTSTVATAVDGAGNPARIPLNGEGYDTALGFDVMIATTVSMNQLFYQGTQGETVVNAKDRNTPLYVNDTAKKVFGTLDNPRMDTAQAGIVAGVPHGVEYFRMNANSFQALISALSPYPWITQGIVGVWIVPNNVPFADAPSRYYFKIHSGSATTYSADIWGGIPTSRVRPQKIVAHDHWRDEFPLPRRYRHLKKFLTYPYMIVEMTTGTGVPLVLKPESIQSDALACVQYAHIVYPNPRIAFSPYRYNAGHSTEVLDGDSSHPWRDGGEGTDMLTGYMNLPQFSVVNNSFLAYMAQNAHSIAYQHQQADWTQQRALTGNQLAYNQASSGMELANTLNRIGVQQANASMDLANTTSMYRGLAGGANSLIGAFANPSPVGLIGAVGGMVSAGMTAGIDINQQTQQTGINNAARTASTSASVSNMGYVRDTNKAYADYAAQGDYGMAIAAINAKVQDAKMIQPTTSGQIGGDAFMLAVQGWQVQYRVKGLQQAAYTTIGEFWLRYGYAVNRFVDMPDSLMVMDHFTYWKCKETYISSSACPEAFKQTLRGIFEKGVTVWANPDDLGRLDPSENDPVQGVYL